MPKVTTELSHLDIAKLEHAKVEARRKGHPLNVHVTLSPWFDRPGEKIAHSEYAPVFRSLMKHLAMWCRRHAGGAFTYLAVRHADEDGSRPHLHVLLHLPTSDHRGRLAQALYKVHGVDGVVETRKASDQQERHPSGYWGSSFDYVTRFKSQKAFRRQGGRSWRASRPDENGRHVGIKTPYAGRRWSCSRALLAGTH